jgi:hypothetical protein
MVQGMERRARLLAAVMVLVLALGAPAKAAPVPADSGEAWDWPLSPTPDVVTGFHPPITPYGPGHVGVDLLGWPGQPVTAVADGTVHFAGQVAGTQVVSVMHGAERSTYHLGRRAGDIYLDPLALVGGGPVRLLPLDGAPAPPMPPGFETPVWETLHQGVSLGLW